MGDEHISGSENEIILISSDDEDAEEVVLISSDEDFANEIELSTKKLHNHDFSIKKEPKELLKGRLNFSEDEGFCKSYSSDDELPDIPNIKCFSKVPLDLKSSHQMMVLCAGNIDSSRLLVKDEQRPIKTALGSKSMRSAPVKRPCKRIKVEDESYSLETSGEKEDISTVHLVSERKTEVSVTVLAKHKKKVLINLITGELRKDVTSLCSQDIDSCFMIHQKEGRSTPSSIQAIYLWDVMLEDSTLTHFALRSMHQAVTKRQFLHHRACKMLMQHIHGSEEKMIAPDLQDVYLGVAILKKQLKLHPSCKKEMRQYYLEMCRTWWPCLIMSADNILSMKSPVKDQVLLKEEGALSPAPVTLEESLLDFTDVIRKEEVKRHILFQNISQVEKIHRITMLLKYFASVMNANVIVWLVKFRHNKSTAAFRKDISPIVAEITWGNDTVNFGSVNQNVKKLFLLFTKSSEEQSLHSVLSLMIHMTAVIILRQEKCSFPEMGSLTRSFAYELFSVIQASSNVEKNVHSIQPHWLRFLVGSYLIDVAEPPNFYQAKERINQLLIAKDAGECDKCFDVEKICYLILESMSIMIGFSTVLTESLPSIDRLTEEEDLWFNDMLSDNFLEKNIVTLQHAVSLPSVKCENRKGYYFDYIET